jgi:hypothetical protein
MTDKAKEKYVTELHKIMQDAQRERQAVEGIETDQAFDYQLFLRAFKALREHRELEDGLFSEDDEPTDTALLTIYAFLVLP